VQVKFVGVSDLDPVLPVAVVVDVMRAFTTAAHALDRGAYAVILAGSRDEVARLKQQQPDLVAITDGPPRTGFDTVNSPAIVAALDLTGRTVAMATTAGTTGALAARHAGLLLCASFVVADATADLLRAIAADDITFVITGDHGNAEEDRACAEYIARRIIADSEDITPYLHRAANSAASAQLREGLRLGYAGIHPTTSRSASRPTRFPFAMAVSVDGSLLTLRPYAKSRPKHEIQ
jgi:2-phosphosulfolactate phosphatase